MDNTGLFVFLSGPAFEQCSKEDDDSGRDGEPDVGGRTPSYEYHDVYQHPVVLATADHLGVLLLVSNDGRCRAGRCWSLGFVVSAELRLIQTDSRFPG